MTTAISGTEKSCIERAFGAEVQSAEFLLSGQKGLSIIFKNEADVESVSLATRCELSHRYGFLRLRNVFWEVSERDHITPSNFITSDGTLEQDPFHRDGQIEGESETFTELSNLYIPRIAPTFYARTEAVRAAIHQLSEEGQYSHEIAQALKAMSEPNYPFVFFGEETARVRLVLQTQFPEFTQRVFDRIPHADKYAQYWVRAQCDVIIQGNGPDTGILHARPASFDRCNPLLCNRYEA
jgi:hypothetical protein